MSEQPNETYQPHPARWLLVILGAISINLGIGMVRLGYTPEVVGMDPQMLKVLPMYLFVAGLLKMIFGMMLFAKAKGRSQLWGALGLLSVIPVFGLLIIVAIYTFLDNRLPEPAVSTATDPDEEKQKDG